MIYFDDEKKAYAYEIKNYICAISDEEWFQYANTDKWDIIDEEFVDISETPEYIARKAQEEQDRIDRLIMTPLDFIGVLQTFGLTLEQINAYLESNLSVKMQLTYCDNVFCGVAKSLMPISFENIVISADMVEKAFRLKNGEIIEESEVENEETV